jgi:hypothetical protein
MARDGRTGHIDPSQRDYSRSVGYSELIATVLVYAITGERRINESRRGIGRRYRGRGGLCGWTRDVGGQREAGKEKEAGEEVGGAGEVD